MEYYESSNFAYWARSNTQHLRLAEAVAVENMKSISYRIENANTKEYAYTHNYTLGNETT